MFFSFIFQWLLDLLFQSESFVSFLFLSRFLISLSWVLMAACRRWLGGWLWTCGINVNIGKVFSFTLPLIVCNLDIFFFILWDPCPGLVKVGFTGYDAPRAILLDDQDIMMSWLVWDKKIPMLATKPSPNVVSWVLKYPIEHDILVIFFSYFTQWQVSRFQ